MNAKDLMVWDYEVAQDVAPWDYNGGREDFERFVTVTGWSKPVQENIAEFEAAFTDWYRMEYRDYAAE